MASAIPANLTARTHGCSSTRMELVEKTESLVGGYPTPGVLAED